MSQRASLTPALPEEDEVRLAIGVAGGGDGAAVAGERLPAIGSTGDETWMLAAVAGEGQNDTSSRVVGELRNALSTASLEDAGAAMKQAYRKINASLYQQGMGRQTASAVALVARGKYATIANVGDGRAYLMRAGRLNQVTRDITPTPLKSGKAKDQASDSPKAAAITRLGERDRLDSRQPAIYELTLLPEDRVLLCTSAVYHGMDEQSLVASLVNGDPEQSVVPLGAMGGSSAAAVATVSAARVRQPVIVGSEGQSSALPLIAALVVVVLLVAAYIAYTMFL